MKKIQIVLCCIMMLLISSSFLPNPHNQPIKTIIIDAGHGGKDPGAMANGIKEKDITLKIALATQKLLQDKMPEIKVILTRSTDVFIELNKRGSYATKHNADFFLSIHCNSVALHNTKPKGTEVYILGTNKGQERYDAHIRENQVVMFEKNYKNNYDGFDPNTPEGKIFYSVVKNVFRKESMKLASKIDYQVLNRLGRKTHGVKQAPFIVLWQSGIPSALVETGYITNPEEAKFLNSSEGQAQVAEAIYYAIKEYNDEVSIGSGK